MIKNLLHAGAYILRCQVNLVAAYSLKHKTLFHVSTQL